MKPLKLPERYVITDLPSVNLDLECRESCVGFGPNHLALRSCGILSTVAKKYEVEEWLRKQCADYKLTVSGVYRGRGDDAWPLTAVDEDDLLRQLDEGGHILPLPKESAEAGYDYKLKVLNAADYGVPQARPRLFIIGMPKGNMVPDHLEPLTALSESAQI